MAQLEETRAARTVELGPTPLLPDGFLVPASRWTHPSTRMRELLECEPYLFGPGVYDPMGAQLAMYHGFKAVYFSGYSFAMGHLGTTDMDLYDSVEIADAARRTVSALRKFQLTQAVGDPEKGVPPKRCGHIGGKALIPASEMVGKLRMARAVADDCGNPDFVIIARTDGLSAVDAPEPARGIELAIERGLRYLDTGLPDLLWCEFPTSDRAPLETFAEAIRKRFPEARFAFNWSSSFKWYRDPDPFTFAELGDLGFKFVFITLGGQHAMGHGLSQLLERMGEVQEQGYIELQEKEWAEGKDFPTRSHHFFSGVPYHHLVGKAYDAARLGSEFVEHLPEDRVV